MSDDLNLRAGAPMRDRVDRLLERAFADEPKFRDAFLAIPAAQRRQIVSEATVSGDAEALRHIETALEEISKQQD